ncbi:sensory neuron membrane protein 1-like, partial [Trichoplusia ni]|uniref:Sensory neuron membrane protein 1-like n=1 Tax=Trichoplusia ni TaxID=7111 RepID=A0A7E5WMJ0_TRINI
ILQGLALNKTFVKMLKNQLFIPKRVVGVIRWWMVSFGSLGAVVGIVYHFRDHIMRLAVTGDTKVTKVTPEEEEQKDISVIGQAQEPAKVTM